MRSISAWLTVGVLLLALSLSCGQQRSSLEAHGSIPSQNKGREILLNDSNAQVAVESVDFYAWWWSEEQLSAGVYRQPELPPRNTYIKVDSWRDSGDADVLHPDLIDVVSQVKNAGNQPADLILTAKADFKVEAYERVENDKSGRPLDEMLQEVPWTQERIIGQTEVRNVEAGESRQVQFKDFNLRAILRDYSDANNSAVWPWLLRVRVIVESPGGGLLAQEEAVLKILAGH